MHHEKSAAIDALKIHILASVPIATRLPQGQGQEIKRDLSSGFALAEDGDNLALNLPLTIPDALGNQDGIEF
jgi:hypothetical protein